MCIRQTTMLTKALTWVSDWFFAPPLNSGLTCSFLCPHSCLWIPVWYRHKTGEPISEGGKYSIHQPPGSLLKLTFSFQERLPEVPLLFTLVVWGINWRGSGSWGILTQTVRGEGYSLFCFCFFPGGPQLESGLDKQVLGNLLGGMGFLIWQLQSSGDKVFPRTAS